MRSTFEFDLVCAAMGKSITNIARVFRCSGESVEDSRQDALILLLDFLDDHEPSAPGFEKVFKTYLRRRLIDKKRRLFGIHKNPIHSSRRRNLLGSAENRITEGRTTYMEREVGSSEEMIDAQDEIDQFAATLKPRSAAIVRMLSEGHNYDDIASHLGVSANHVCHLVGTIRPLYRAWMDRRK